MPETAQAMDLGDLIEPMPGKIVVRLETKSDRTATGLYIPLETARSIHEARATQGVVVAIGDDDEDDLESPPRRVNLGDTVLFGKYTGTKITWQPPDDRSAERQEVIIMSEDSVLAILRSPEQARDIKVKA